jgi:hypothetical protein
MGGMLGRHHRGKLPPGICEACAHLWDMHLLPDACDECAYERDHGMLEQGASVCWQVPPPDPAGLADRRLDVYRSRYARVVDDGVAHGYLGTFVQTWWTRQGPWWRRRWTNPRELPHWLWVTDAGLVDDGVVLEEHLDQELADWNASRFAYQGRYLRLHWLNDPEASAVRREYFAQDDRLGR